MPGLSRAKAAASRLPALRAANLATVFLLGSVVTVFFFGAFFWVADSVILNPLISWLFKKLATQGS